MTTENDDWKRPDEPLPLLKRTRTKKQKAYGQYPETEGWGMTFGTSESVVLVRR